MSEAFFELAAEIFGVPRAELSPETAYEVFPAWDSVAHLRLVMETEARFGVPIPFEAIPRLRTLADFAPYARA